ncbi:MAG TPA: phosphate signaling complex protein PhoU [Gemmatimonadaceae bacterium]|nr:phosphate signaling complex protein PhoU [Gemmatimonadaceae bacterium]
MSATGATPGFRHFHEELDALKQKLLDMSGKAEAMLALSVDALMARDEGLADAVLAADREIDSLEIEIENHAVSLLALQQPMARDLRFIVGAIKISSDLERVGDHAVNIAEATQRLIAAGPVALSGPMPAIAHMATRARAMLGDALRAFVRPDGQMGRAVCAMDDEVDELHESVFRVLLTHMMENPTNITASLQLLLVSRNLERIGDLATNIAEDAVFLAEGKQIKHHFEGGRS